MGRNYPNRLIQAAEVVRNLVPIGTIPQTETQARPLTRLEPEVQQAVWQAAHRSISPEFRPAAAQTLRDVSNVLGIIGLIIYSR
jgi:hypothetical protein